MTTKQYKNSLSDALNSAGRQEIFANNTNDRTTYKNIKSREGKKMVAAYFSSDIHKTLKILAVQNNTSIQDIVHEAINDYLKARGY